MGIVRAQRMAIVVGGCAVLVGAGFAAAPPGLSAGDPVAAPTGGAAPGPTDGQAAAPTQDPAGGTDGDGAGDGTGGDGTDGAASAETFDGPPISNARGTYQARITVVNGEVVDVAAVVAGTSAAESQLINERAIPEFRERVLAAQTWDVEAVSGASFTSPAFIESLQGAFGDAGLS